MPSPPPPSSPDRGQKLSAELDARLVGKVREGDGEALVSIFEAYHEPLCAFAERLLDDPGEAEDLVVDVFARVWETREDWHVRHTARSYLFQAVRNRAISVLRHRRVVGDAHARARAEGIHPGLGEGPTSPEDELFARELGEIVRSEIERLPRRCREAFTHHRWDGLTYAEIAEVMGVSVRTVENQIARALELLREAVQHRRRAARSSRPGGERQEGR